MTARAKAEHFADEARDRGLVAEITEHGRDAEHAEPIYMVRVHRYDPLAEGTVLGVLDATSTITASWHTPRHLRRTDDSIEWVAGTRGKFLRGDWSRLGVDDDWNARNARDVYRWLGIMALDRPWQRDGASS